MAIPIVGSIISTIVGAVAKYFTVGAVISAAIKTLFVAMMTTVLPIVLYNVFGMILKEYLEFVSGYVGTGGLESAVIHITGIGGWIATKLNLTAAIAVVLSATATRVGLNMIPFTRI